MHQWKEWFSVEKDIPCASSAHTMKLFSCYHLVRCSPRTAIPFYFCPVFYYPLTHVTARNGTQHSCNTTNSKDLKPHRTTQLYSAKSLAVPQCWLLPRSLPACLGGFSAASQSFFRAKQLMKPVTEAEATWPWVVPNGTKGILPRLSLRGLGNHLLAENNSHICCSSTSCFYLFSQSSFLLGPDFSSYYRILTRNTDAHKELRLETAEEWAPDQLYSELSAIS